MKIFVGEKNCCNLIYQDDLIRNKIINTKHDIVENPEEADIIIFPSSCCTQQVQFFNTLKYVYWVVSRKKRDAKVILTGCSSLKMLNEEAKKYQQLLYSMVDDVIELNHPLEILNIIEEKKDYDANLFGRVLTNNNYADIHIVNGCNNKCTFCKKTFLEFPIKSTPLKEVFNSLDELDKKGYQYLYIFGTNVCQYGLDIKASLKDIIEYVETKENLNRISLVGFSYGDAIRRKFTDIIASSKKIVELNGGLESGSNRLLKLIKKGFSREEILYFVKEINKIYKKSLIFNIISGLPTESIDDINITLDTIKQLNPKKIVICRYVNSPFVESNNYKQLTPKEIENHTQKYIEYFEKNNIDYWLNPDDGYKYNLTKKLNL